MDLHLLYVKSEDNPADCHSRRLSALDYMLTREKFETIEKRFGPHSVDLMSLDSNCMISQVNGKPLRHFTPYPTPLSAGVNVFSQDITLEKNPYVFPPFKLILPLIVYLKNQGVGVVQWLFQNYCQSQFGGLWSVSMQWIGLYLVRKGKGVCFYSLQNPGFLKQNMGYCMI